MIVCAADKIFDKRQQQFVVLPIHRHSHGYQILCDLGFKTTDYIWKSEWQGFINEHGDFLTRREAAREAYKCGQIKEYKPGQELYSEDLW